MTHPRPLSRLALALVALAPPALGDVVFTPPRNAVGGTQDWQPAATGDFDGDGHADVVLAEIVGFNGILHTALGAGDGTFSAIPAGTGTAPITPVLAVDDFDLDGDLDLLTRQFSTEPLSLALGAGDGTFGAPLVLPDQPGDLVFIVGAVAGRLDADLLPDVVAMTDGEEGNGVPARLYVFGNLGGGGFELRRVIEIPYGPRAIASDDIDGDGRADVAISFLDGHVELYHGTVTGVLTPGEVPVLGSSLLSVALADVDQDLDPDLLALDLGGTAVGLRRNDGSGSFGPLESVAVAADAGELKVFDADGDGTNDLVIRRRTIVFPDFFDGLDVHRGFCDGSFGPAVAVQPLGDQLAGLLPLDANEDGLLDLAVSPDLEFLATMINASAGPSHVELGAALAGTPVGGSSPAQLDTAGSLIEGEPLCWTLRHALPGAPAFLVLGFTQADAPFKAGVMVPSPDLISGALPVDLDGELALAATWPSGASGFGFFAQVWYQDPGGPAGWAASPGVAASAP